MPASAATVASLLGMMILWKTICEHEEKSRKGERGQTVLQRPYPEVKALP